jgi:hypothetical protein
LARFDHWTAEVAVGDNGVTLKENHVQQGVHKGSANAAISFGDPPTVSFTTAKAAVAQKK